MQVLHRARERLVGQRTALMNQIRSILLERGLVVAQGRRKLLEALGRVADTADQRGLRYPSDLTERSGRWWRR